MPPDSVHVPPFRQLVEVQAVIFWLHESPWYPVVIKLKKNTTVGTIQKSNCKKLQKEAKLIPLTHIYMAAHFPDLVTVNIIILCAFLT